MDEVWAVLDEEFGQVLDHVSGLVRRLLAFKVSKEAKTESLKFMELSRMWNKICADLRELDKLEALNHKPTIAAVGGMLPSLASKNRYIMLRLQMLGEGYDELQIFSDFMKSERKLQKAMERMHKPEETDSKKETGKQGQCTNCGKAGHNTASCWSKKKPNKSHSTQQGATKQSSSSNSKPMKIPCPACNLQHLIQGRNNQYYGSRLSVCPTFKNLSVQDKTTVVENSKACVLCLDW